MAFFLVRIFVCGNMEKMDEKISWHLYMRQTGCHSRLGSLLLISDKIINLAHSESRKEAVTQFLRYNALIGHASSTVSIPFSYGEQLSGNFML